MIAIGCDHGGYTLKEEIKIYREPKNVYQKLVSILDNITGIKKISEIGWVY